MSKETLVFVLGIILILLPYAGIPQSWKLYGYLGIGSLLIIVGYALRRAKYLAEIDNGNGERGTDSFIETTQNLFAEN